MLCIQVGFTADSCELTVFWDCVQHMAGQNQSESHHYSLKSSKNLQQLIFQFTLHVGGCHAVAFLQSLPYLDEMWKSSSAGLSPLFHCPEMIF